jgi:hypothetical protein
MPEGCARAIPCCCYSFLLLVEVLNVLFRKANQWFVLHQRGVHGIPYRAALYADVLVLFLSLVVQDL